MKTTFGNKWASLALLSIVLPLGLFAAFRLTGIVSEPLAISKITTIEQVLWNMDRPVQTVDVIHWTNNSYSDENINIAVGLYVGTYIEEYQLWPSDGNDDVVGIYLTIDADAISGYIYSATARFSGLDAESILFLETHPDFMFPENLEVNRIRYVGTHDHDAYLGAVGTSQPTSISLKSFAYLVFLDQNIHSHEMLGTGEIVFFNGMAYEQVNIPILLKVIQH